MKKILAFCLLGLVSLTGCSEQESPAPDVVSQGNLQMKPLDATETAKWQANIAEKDAYQAVGDLLIHDKQVTVIFSGSSSCPPILETANLEDTTISFTLKKNTDENRACTADLRPFGWSVGLSEEEAGRVAAGRLVNDKGISPLSFTRIAAEQQLEPVRGR